MGKLAWKKWSEVVTLREDLKSGDLPLHLFAADLYEVLMQRGKHRVYEDPKEFFALTFPTFNLRQLVRDVVHRLARKNDKAVRQLELTYGGGKTHTLITLRHLVHDPDSLPDLPAVKEFREEIGQRPPKCRVAGLCFDKLDVEKGMEIRSPQGKVRTLKHPWSVLGYQLAGDDGLKRLHASGKVEERDSAPAENLLAELLELPSKEDLGTLVLVDEVLMFAREKVGADPTWRSRLVNFFQALTQAAAKVDRCCVVASLLATDPKKYDALGRDVQAELYSIFQRQREEAVEPVVKEDVAEVLRRRFFTPKSLQGSFRSHVVAALKGIQGLDDQTMKQGAEAEERFNKSYPFHPDLTEVLYAKWTQLAGFQRTRGVLRTFALALREAEKWDECPVIGPSVLLPPPGKDDLSEALREMVTVADTEESEGKRQAWTGILAGEFGRAREIQKDLVGLKHREIEQAVVATFLHSQPVGQSARTRELFLLVGSTRPDSIELKKGLGRWGQTSFWLDDLHTAVKEGELPGTWRLGNRPNLTQMHSIAAKNVTEETVRARLIDDIQRTKSLSEGAKAAGVIVHTLPAKPKDLEDDGSFRYAILGPNAASESGKPSAEAIRFLDEYTGPERPRVYRNAVVLLAPSRDGLGEALARVRDYLGWEIVRDDIKRQQKDGNVDPARAQTLTTNIENAKSRITGAIQQAYCIVVTVSKDDKVQAFKITVGDEPHFLTIKNDERSRLRETAITADALLPDGPYSLWGPGETSRRVKDLAGAFAQLPRLPKMLKASAIIETVEDGCERGWFVLRLPRPDGSNRSWWMVRPDEDALKDPAIELVLPEVADLVELPPALLSAGRLPGVPSAAELPVKDLLNYFGGTTVVQLEREGRKEPMRVPKASRAVVEKGVCSAVEAGVVWLRSGPASLLAEPVPPGIVTATAMLSAPPASIAPAELLEANLPDAWRDEQTSALAVATALSTKAGKTLPWKTVKDALSSALQARFLELASKSGTWPCDLAAAKAALFKAVSGAVAPPPPPPRTTNVLVAEADLDGAGLQDLGDAATRLLQLKAKGRVPFRAHVRLELGDGKTPPPPEAVKEANSILKSVDENLRFT